MPSIRRTAYLLSALTLAIFIFSLFWKPAPPPPFVGIASGDVPVQIGDWLSQGDYDVAPDVRAALASADIVSRTYKESHSIDSQTIDFVLIGGTDRNALHDPRSCLVGGGWILEDDRVESLPGAGISARACEALAQDEGPGGRLETTGYDIVYLYVVDGSIRNQVTQIRLEMLTSALLGKRNRPVYFLRFMEPLASNPDDQAENHRQLVAFAADAWKAMSARVGM